MKSHREVLFFLISSKARLPEAEFNFVRVNEEKAKHRALVRVSGLREKEKLASGTNRSDPCRRSPSFPLERLCIALAHLTFSV